MADIEPQPAPDAGATPRRRATAGHVGAERRRALHDRLVEALAEPALGCVEGDARTLTYDELTVVSAHDVRRAQLCQASLAAPDEPFETSPALVTRFLALSAGRRLHRTDGCPTTAVRAAMAEAMDAERWPGPWLREQPRAVRALCGAKSITWLGRTLDVTGVDHLRRWQFNRNLTWTFPGRGLKLTAKLDLLSPEPTPVVVVTNTSPHNLQFVAFTLLLLLLNDLRPIDEARIAVHSSGELITVEPDAMVDQAIDAARSALDAVLERPLVDPLLANRGGTDTTTDAAHTTPPLHLTRTASGFGCSACAFTTCPDRHDPTRQASVTRGGIRLR